MYFSSITHKNFINIYIKKTQTHLQIRETNSNSKVRHPIDKDRNGHGAGSGSL